MSVMPNGPDVGTRRLIGRAARRLVVLVGVILSLSNCTSTGNTSTAGIPDTPSPTTTSTAAVDETSTTIEAVVVSQPDVTSTTVLGSTTPSTSVVASASVPSGGVTATVLSVTDGDTLRVRVDGIEERVRLIGINAAENGECTANEATARLAELVVGGPDVLLVVDQSDRDQHDRFLRYVYTADGGFVNEILVREGLAMADRYPPDVTQADVLDVAQQAAQAAQVGMWASDTCGTATAAQLAIGEIHYDADGNDNNNLNDEWIELTNTGAEPADLTGWAIKDESASHRYYFPIGFTLAPGATVRLHTGCGTHTAAALYWCKSGSAVWNNSGDTVFVLDPSGNIAESEKY